MIREDRFEVVVNPSNNRGGRAREWSWKVCDKVSGTPFESGTVTGARSRAVIAGNRAMYELIARRRA